MPALVSLNALDAASKPTALVALDKALLKSLPGETL